MPEIIEVSFSIKDIYTHSGDTYTEKYKLNSIEDLYEYLYNNYINDELFNARREHIIKNSYELSINDDDMQFEEYILNVIHHHTVIKNVILNYQM